MKQTWKSLRSLICQKQQWVKDNDQISCYCCNKQFIKVFRRRHHCRSCGRLFCSNCSQHYINGKYIDQKFQKYLRLCQLCNQKVQTSLRQLNIRLQQQLPDEESQVSSSSSDQQELQILFPIFEQPSISRNEKQLYQQIKSKILLVSNYLVQKHQLQQHWVKTLADFAVQAGDEVVIDSIAGKNSMDITKNVKLQVVQCNDPRCTRIFKGYVSDNNVMSKQMKTSFSKPKIIIIMGSIQIAASTDDKIKFEDLIFKQKPMLRKILGKLTKLNPTLIFVQQVVNFTAKQYLSSKGISIVCKIKQQVLQNIKKVSMIKKSIDKLYKVQTYKQQQVIGTCQKVYFQKHQNGDDKQKTLLYLEDFNSQNISIVLAHNDVSKLQSLRLVMEELLRLSRQFWLQKQIIEIEQFKLMKNNKHIVNWFNSFIYKQITLQRMLTLKKCTFSRAKYTQLDLMNFPDIQNLSQIDFYRKSLPFQFETILKGHWQLCNNPNILTKQFYSQDDISLGGFFLLQIANMNINCQQCGKTKQKHVNTFYYGDKYVKVWLEKSKEIPEDQILQQNNNSVNMYISKQTLHVHLKQKFKGQAINSKRKVVSYIECQDCQSVLSQESYVSKDYLQNSFQYFLLKLLIQKQLLFQKDSQQQLKCSHKYINRVIKTQQGALKFNTGKLKLYSLSHIDFSSQQSKQYLLQKDLVHVNHLTSTVITKIQQYIKSLAEQLNTLSLSSTQTTSKKGLKFKQLQSKLLFACEALQIHTSKVKQKFSSNLQILIKDYTLVQKQIDKIISYLQFIYRVFLKVDHFHKKDKRQDEDTQIQQLTLDNSTVKLQNSGVESNINLNNLKEYIQPYKEIQWGSQQQMNFYSYVPIFKQDPVSLISFALNSKSYQRMKDTGRQITIKISHDDKQQVPEISTITSAISELLKIQNKLSKQQHTVRILYPKQFTEVRNKFGIDDELYVKSLIDCHDLHTTAGKSEAEFQRSFNHMFVIKQIKDKQFIQFAQFFTQYLQHMSSHSYLSKIFGMYQVDGDRCLIVMQNISYMIDSKPSSSFIQYDLKGSDYKRFSIHKQGKKFTGKDTNFKLDRNGQPLYLKPSDYDMLLNTLQYDAQFLNSRGVIDYSLLLIINLEDNTLRMGIIDFMRPYRISEMVEHIYKKMLNKYVPTVVDPKPYKQRLITALRKYFLRSDSLHD